MSTDAAFSSDGSKVIDTVLDVKSQPTRTTCAIHTFYELDRCISWLKNKKDGVSKVALQFPDELLADSSAVVRELCSAIPELTYFILADTSYGSCCVDEVAAQHYNADAFVHFGPSCLSPTSRLPVLCIFGQSFIDICDCEQKLSPLVKDDLCVLMYDVQYEYCAEEICTRLSKSISGICLSKLSDEQSNENKDACPQARVNGRHWNLKDGSKTTDYTIIYIGGESRTLSHLMMVLNQNTFYSYDPETRDARRETVKINKSLMKRFYMVEKAKDARIVVIVAGTLGVSRYLEMHNRLRDMIKKAGKKVYSIVVGKLNPAKLGNFMEADVFVLVSCPENSLIDSSEFYKPVVTPYEMELACNTDREWTGEYFTDFRTLLPEGEHYVPMPSNMASKTDVSLISGGMRKLGVDEHPVEAGNMAVTVRNDNLTVATQADTAGEFLTNRTWRGLEQDLGNTPVEKAKQGLKGIAMSYNEEPV